MLKKQREIVFIDHEADEFIVDSQECDKKDVADMIKGKAEELLETSDVYYSYIYDDTVSVCRYIAVKSQKHMSGKTSVLTQALLVPGKYVYVAGRRHYIIEHTDDGHVALNIHHERQDDAVDVSTMAPPAELPPGARLVWSLQKRELDLSLLSLAVFVVVALWFAYTLNSYNAITAKAKDLVAKAAKPAAEQTTGGTLDITGAVQEVVSRLPAGATIRQVKIENNNIGIVVGFANDDVARTFLKNSPFGGTYEDGKVVIGLGGSASPGSSTTR